MTLTSRLVISTFAKSVLALTLVASFVGSSSFRFGESRPLDSFPLVVPTVKYGLETQRYKIVEGISSDTELQTVLRKNGLGRLETARLVALISQRTLVEDLNDKAFAKFYNDEDELRYFGIAINPHEYLRIDLQNKDIAIADRQGVQAEYQSATLFYDGDIQQMLTHTTMDPVLKNRIQQGLELQMPLPDSFTTGLLRIVYQVKRNEEGDIIGYGGLDAIRYKVNGRIKTAIKYASEDLEITGFFSPDGRAARRTWLPSPVPGARLSSAYNLRRKHPILNRIKPHYGTDYAAPYGTPILAVSDGIVTARSRTRGNGKFVKIKHNDTYQTQYLHMKGFAKGIKPGASVKKGQVIGYIGSTGLADGPHVCFRFWKNGKQIDHRREDLPTTEDLKADQLQAFEDKQRALEVLLAIRA